jgi:hypothetical protein
MSIDELDVLVGSWRLTGRSKDSDHDDIAGETHGRRILDGNLLELTGTIRVGSLELPSLELIWADPDGGFGAHAYGTSGAPLEYRWSRDGSTLIHAGLGATYTGTISPDGMTIEGGWRPDPGQPMHAGSHYDATMRRIS